MTNSFLTKINRTIAIDIRYQFIRNNQEKVSQFMSQCHHNKTPDSSKTIKPPAASFSYDCLPCAS